MGIELDKEDLFGDSASNRLLLDDDKSATIFAAFNAVNNLQRTLVETVRAEIKREGLEEDLKSIREKTMEKLVISIKSKGEEMSIDEVIGEALEASTHFVGNSIETAKKNIITSEIVEKSNKIVNANTKEVDGKVPTLQERIIAIETESYDRSNQEVINSLVLLEKEPEVSKGDFELSLIAKRDEEKVRVSEGLTRLPEVQVVEFIDLKQNGVAKTNHPMKNYTYVMYNTMDEAKSTSEVVDMNEAKANLELTAKEAGLVSVDDTNGDLSLSSNSLILSAPTNIKTLAPLFSASKSLEIRNGLIGNENVELRFDDKLNKWYAMSIAQSASFEAKAVTQLVEGENQQVDFANNYMTTQKRQQFVSEGDFKLIEGEFDGYKVYSLDFCNDYSLPIKGYSKLSAETMEDAPIATAAPIAAAASATELGDVAKDVVFTVYAIATELVDVLSKEPKEPGKPGEPGEPGEPVVNAKIGEQEYYDHMKVRYDSFFDTYKETYIDMSTTDANGVKSFWLDEAEEIASHSVFTDYNDGGNSSVNSLQNAIQEHMNGLGVQYTYYAPMNSLISALIERSQWKQQIDKTYNLTLLGSIKSHITANNNWRISQKNTYESKFSSGTLTDHNEIRSYLDALFYLEYGSYSLLNYIDEKIAKANESKYDEKQWVSIDDLKITLIDKEFAKIDFKDSTKKVSYEDGSYASKNEMSGVTVKLSDFDKNEEGSYITQYSFTHNTSKGYSGLLSEVLFNGNKGQYITYMVARPNGEIDLVPTQVSLSNGRIQWDYKIGGEMLTEDVWSNVFGEGFIVQYKNGASRRDTGVGTYWYLHKLGNTTETYPNWYKSQLSSFTSQGIGDEMFADYRLYGKYKYSHNHSEEHGLRNIYSVNGLNSLSDNGKYVQAMNEYYRLSDYYSTRESLGVMTEELSGDLYAKSDKDGSYPKIYTFDGESYNLYSGYVYHKQENNEIATTSEELWRDRYYVMYYICIGGQLFNNNRNYSDFGLRNIQGWKDCDGLERSKVMLANNSYFTNQFYTAEFGPEFKGWSLSMENLTGEKITVSLDDYDSYFDVFRKDGVDHQLGQKVIQYLSSNQSAWGRYLWETNVDFENKVLSFKMVTSGYARGLGMFGITTDVNGKFNYEQELCLDTDGDGVYDQIDGWPNDPSYSYDYDGDGVPDEIDPFPYDIDPTYSILTDLINGGNFVIPTSMVKFLNGYSEFVYVIEDKAGPVVKALSFDGVSSTNDEGYPELALTSQTRIIADEKMAEHYGGAVLMAQELMSKYNEKDGKK